MQRPYVIVNVAMSADGKLDYVSRKGTNISSSEDKSRVDRLRANVDAILVGGRTALDDDPKLTVKSKALQDERIANGTSPNPVKVAVVSDACFNNGSNFITAGPARRLVFTTQKTPQERIYDLERAGVEVFVSGKTRVNLNAVLTSLFDLGIRKLLVEGGGEMIAEFFRLGVVDELMSYVAPVIFGGATAPTLADGVGFRNGEAPVLRLEAADEFDEEGGVLLHYRVAHPELNE